MTTLVTEPQLAKTWPGTYTASDLAASSVDSSELADGGIDEGHFSASCVTATVLADDAVEEVNIIDDAVAFEKLEKAYVAKDVAAILDSNGATSKAMTFGETFAAAPSVFANVNDGSATTAQIGIGSITTTGCTLAITDASDTSVTVTVAVFACEKG